MQQLFSQKLRFKDENGEDYPDWKEKKLDDIGIFFSGGTPYTSNIEYYNGNIPFIKSGEIDKSITEQFISKNGLENSSAKLVNKGNILFALYGANSGQVAISKIDGAINQAVLNIKTNEDNIFLYYYFIEQKEQIIKTYLQGGQGNLSSQIVKSLKFFFPSINEQKKIVKLLSAFDIKIEKIQNELEIIKEFKKGLLQQMFC